MEHESEGSKVLELLNGFVLEPLPSNIQSLYQSAYGSRIDQPEEAIKFCREALARLVESPRISLGDSAVKTYARGRCCLLLASIYLDQGQQAQLEEAEKHYEESRQVFHRQQWSHLESLAFLGLAITQRILGRFQEANKTCNQAETYIYHESVPNEINKRGLLQAIDNERAEIQKAQSIAETTPPAPPPEDQEEKKVLPIFIISACKEINPGRPNELNNLTRKDYENLLDPEEVILDYTKRSSAQAADYILEIDEKVKVEDDLEVGDWLLIGNLSEKTLRKGSIVAVLIRENNETRVSLKTYFRDKDHWLLRGKNNRSIVIADNRSDFSKIRDSYAIYGERVLGKLAHDIQIIGPVIRYGHIPKRTTSEITKVFLWKIPVVDSIAAGLGSIDRDHVIRQVILEKQHRREGVHFGVKVEGESMRDAGIHSGQIAVIQQQQFVKNGDIAALVIDSAGSEPQPVIKEFYVVTKKPDQRHWLLMSKNPTSENLVVVPKGSSSIEAIQNDYLEAIEKGRINNFVLIKEAELRIAGKYIQVLPNN